MTKAFNLTEGSLQWQFLESRAKMQMFGGGFANGKTATVCLKALMVGKDYPGANILMARSTYPKLNDTLRKEFLLWCPPEWIKRKALSTDNIVELHNGTTYNFRYIEQQGKGKGESTSNLLSATYDLIVVDQIEDPEISHKDLLDLLGRLRGMAKYQGTDPTMPKSGPRWMLITTNPTRNWVYLKLVKPLHLYKRDIQHKDLMLNEETGKPMMDLFEGSTYSNRENLEEDFIQTLESAYRGQMRERFLLGQWAAYEGLVYPTYDPDIHMVLHKRIEDYFYQLIGSGYNISFIEGFDYGLAQPSCYLLGFVDPMGSVILVDGFYKKEMTIEEMQHRIRGCRAKWGAWEPNRILADPAVFRRTTGGHKTVGMSIAGMFQEYGIQMVRANNDIESGIMKVQMYLHIQKFHRNPFTKQLGAPFLYISDHLEFVNDEFGSYYWRKNSDDVHEDRPNDKDDHAMDTIKYIVSFRPDVSKIKQYELNRPAFMQWHEYTEATDNRGHRYG